MARVSISEAARLVSVQSLRLFTSCLNLVSLATPPL